METGFIWFGIGSRDFLLCEHRYEHSASQEVNYFPYEPQIFNMIKEPLNVKQTESYLPWWSHKSRTPHNSRAMGIECGYRHFTHIEPVLK
jgi:hypothetical protein